MIGKLTSPQSHYDHGCNQSISLTVDGKDGAVVCGERCEPSQRESAILCVLHGDVPPSSQRSTGKIVASDHPIALCNIRGGPRECHAPCSRSDHEIQWWTSWSWGKEVEHTHIQDKLYFTSFVMPGKTCTFNPKLWSIYSLIYFNCSFSQDRNLIPHISATIQQPSSVANDTPTDQRCCTVAEMLGIKFLPWLVLQQWRI